MHTMIKLHYDQDETCLLWHVCPIFRVNMHYVNTPMNNLHFLAIALDQPFLNGKNISILFF